MLKNKKILVGGIFILIILLFIFYSFIQPKNIKPKQMIFIGVDGMQVARYNKLLSQDRLPNFKKLISNNGTSSEVLITGHTLTETAPGNAELLTGLSASTTGIFNNDCGAIIPVGDTIFERLNKFNSKIKIGSVYGKQTCYIPLSILNNAKSDIDWWQDMSTYPNEKYITDKCANSIDVAAKALEFINLNKDKSFFLFVYFGAPDCAGHSFGLPSVEYDEALINVDGGLSILLGGASLFGVNPEIIISGDHGWNTWAKGHGTANQETLNVALITNNSNLINGADSTQKRKQCDITPTILDYFGMIPN
jgi:predicted AlkP superfamily pyrophosphatase or phosphodiesterase